MGGGAARFAGQDPPRVRWVRGDGREMQVRGGAAAADDFLPVRQQVGAAGWPVQWPSSHTELRS